MQVIQCGNKATSVCRARGAIQLLAGKQRRACSTRACDASQHIKAGFKAHTGIGHTEIQHFVSTCSASTPSFEMRTGIPIMLFVAVAGFHNAISASLEFDTFEADEERMYEENVTTTQNESEYAAARVNVTEDLIKTTHMDGETETLTFDADGETEALTVDAGENTGSDISVAFQQKTELSVQAEEIVKGTERKIDDDDDDEEFEDY
ncbi:hypothetical protein R3I93_021373 [Phoxinus phoxinus]|uniref:Uncharacterized protein n=1 Tax=Phoxinus phoxinus TaxID=58324 RepID=A0AAN9C9P5_9TELE